MGKLIRPAVLLIIILGAITGFLSFSGETPEHGRLLYSLDVYLNAINTQGNSFSFFARRALVYAQPILIIWFLAFVPPAAILSCLILFLHTFGLGFTTAALWELRGTDGLIRAALLLLPQNIIWLPVCCYVVSGCLKQAARHTRVKLFLGSPQYTSRLLMGLLISISAAFIETWVTPLLLK